MIEYILLQELVCMEVRKIENNYSLCLYLTLVNFYSYENNYLILVHAYIIQGWKLFPVYRFDSVKCEIQEL